MATTMHDERIIELLRVWKAADHQTLVAASAYEADPTPQNRQSWDQANLEARAASSEVCHTLAAYLLD